MVTLRHRIVASLADLLDTGVDWDVVTRDLANEVADSPRKAVVYFGVERKRVDSPNRYRCTLQIAVRVIVSAQEIEEGQSADEVLDESMAELERLLPQLADPAAALNVPGLQLVDVETVSLDAPDEETGEISGTITLSATYHHDLDNPSTFGGVA